MVTKWTQQYTHDTENNSKRTVLNNTKTQSHIAHFTVSVTVTAFCTLPDQDSGSQDQDQDFILCPWGASRPRLWSRGLHHWCLCIKCHRTLDCFDWYYRVVLSFAQWLWNELGDCVACETLTHTLSTFKLTLDLYQHHKGRWCSAAGKVIAGLAESNSSLPPGGRRCRWHCCDTASKHTCWSPFHSSCCQIRLDSHTRVSFQHRGNFHHSDKWYLDSSITVCYYKDQ